MNMLDIIGPAMVGPSSSHTAGAVRIGRIAKKLMAERIVEAELLLHGSSVRVLRLPKRPDFPFVLAVLC